MLCSTSTGTQVSAIGLTPVWLCSSTCSWKIKEKHDLFGYSAKYSHYSCNPSNTKTSLLRVPAYMLASVLVCGFFSTLQIHTSDTTDYKFYSFAAYCAHCLQHGLWNQRLLGPLELSELEIWFKGTLPWENSDWKVGISEFICVYSCGVLFGKT